MAQLVLVDSDDLAAALKVREEFLKSHPELMPLQWKIEEQLTKANSQHNRLVVIHNLMMDSIARLSSKLKELHRILR